MRSVRRLADVAVPRLHAVAVTWWFLSYADPSAPAGRQALGACLVEARSAGEANRVAWILGCNPGGEVIVHPVPAEFGAPPRTHAGRLLDRAALEDLMRAWSPDDPRVTTVGELAGAGVVAALAVTGQLHD